MYDSESKSLFSKENKSVFKKVGHGFIYYSIAIFIIRVMELYYEKMGIIDNPSAYDFGRSLGYSLGYNLGELMDIEQRTCRKSRDHNGQSFHS